jgi:hypothetical protein
MNSATWRYCSLIWWQSNISPFGCGVATVNYTPEGSQMETLYESKAKLPGIVGVPKEDYDRIRNLVGSTIARLGMDGWEAVHGDPSGTHWQIIEGGCIFFKRPALLP